MAIFTMNSIKTAQCFKLPSKSECCWGDSWNVIHRSKKERKEREKAEVGHVSQLAPQRKSKRGHVWGRYESARRLYYYTARLYNIHHTLRRKFSWKISKNSFEFRKWKFFKCLDPHWWIGANNNDVLSPFYLYHFDNSNQQKKNRVPYMRMIQFIVVMCTLTAFYCCYEIENRPAWRKKRNGSLYKFLGAVYI